MSPQYSYRRRWLNQSVYSAVAYSRWATVRHGPRRLISSVLYRPLIVSASALSNESPVVPTEAAIPASARRSVYRMDVYCEPRSVCATTELTSEPARSRVHTACSRASRTSWVLIVVAVRQPMIRRANASMTNATYTHPDQVETNVMSATHSWSGAEGLKLRPTRSRARSAAGSATVVRLTLPRTTPCRASRRIRRSTVHLATPMPSRLRASHTFRAPYTP